MTTSVQLPSGSTALPSGIVPQITPLDYGGVAWTLDPALTASAGGVFATGNFYYAQAKMAKTAPITNVVLNLAALAVSLTYAVVVIYDINGNQIGITANQSANWTTPSVAGVKVIPLVTPTSTLTAGTIVYAAINTIGTTGPNLRIYLMGTRGPTMNQSVGAFRVGVNVGGATNPAPTTLVQSTTTAPTMMPIILLT